jgi:hypothetical protein
MQRIRRPLTLLFPPIGVAPASGADIASLKPDGLGRHSLATNRTIRVFADVGLDGRASSRRIETG